MIKWKSAKRSRIIQRAFNRIEISSVKYKPKEYLSNGSIRAKVASMAQLFNLKVGNIDMGGFIENEKEN